MTKILSFLTLLTYINTITYLNSHGGYVIENPTDESETLIEYMLEDILHIPVQHASEDPDVQHDEYRCSSLSSALLPLKTKETSSSNLIPIYQLANDGTHSFDTKIICQPGYYTYLFRLKPF